MATIIRRGERQWQARVHRKAVHTGATFETKTRAVAWARQIEADIDAGRFQPGRLEAERPTLFEALDRYLAEIVPQKRGQSKPPGLFGLGSKRRWGCVPSSGVGAVGK